MFQDEHKVCLPLRHINAPTKRFADFAANYEIEAAAVRSFQPPASTEAHFAVIDAVKLVGDNTKCVTGARDYSLSMWDLSREKIAKACEIKQAHTVTSNLTFNF